MGGNHEPVDDASKPAAEGEPGAAASAPPAEGRWTQWLHRVGEVRAAAIAAAVVAVLVAISVLGKGGPATASQPQARNFDLAVLGHPAQHLTLVGLAGRPVIVNFFASWCEPCQHETPLIARYYRAHGSHPVIIGVDVNDSATKALAFVHRMGVRYPVGVDTANAAAAYGLPGLPATFFLNAQHRIVKRVYGAVSLASLTTGTRLMRQRTG